MISSILSLFILTTSIPTFPIETPTRNYAAIVPSENSRIQRRRRYIRSLNNA